MEINTYTSKSFGIEHFETQLKHSVPETLHRIEYKKFVFIMNSHLFLVIYKQN